MTPDQGRCQVDTQQTRRCIPAGRASGSRTDFGHENHRCYRSVGWRWCLHCIERMQQRDQSPLPYCQDTLGFTHTKSAVTTETVIIRQRVDVDRTDLEQKVIRLAPNLVKDLMKVICAIDRILHTAFDASFPYSAASSLPRQIGSGCQEALLEAVISKPLQAIRGSWV